MHLSLNEDSVKSLLIAGNTAIPILALVSGMIIFLSSLFELRKLGSQQTGSTGKTIAFGIAGIVLINWALTVANIGEQLFASQPSPFDLNGINVSGTHALAQLAFGFMSVYGAYSMLKGMWLLRRIGDPAFVTQGITGRVFFHILAGAALYYLPSTSALFSQNVGMDIVRQLGGT